MHKITAAAATSLTLACGTAFAADLPLRSAPPPFVAPPTFTWTGGYVGINAGYDFGNTDKISIGLPSGVFGGIGPISFQGASLNAAGTNAVLKSESDGFTGGGQVGYNYQFGAGSGIVVGVEADAEYVDAEKTTTYGFGRVAVGPAERAVAAAVGLPFNGPLAGVGVVPAFAINYKTSLDYLSTIRGRAGYSFGQFLLYGTGGFAFGGVSRSATLDVAGAQIASTSLHDTETGYAYGGGVEYALPTNSFLNFVHAGAVTIKGEYLHYNLGNAKGTVNVTIPGVGAAGVSARLTNEGDIARGGINYKF